MKSERALFNKGVCLNYLKRYWPLWLAYLIIVMMTVPGGILPQLDNQYIRSEDDAFWFFVDMNRTVLRIGSGTVGLSIVSGIIAAMVMYSYMYTTRGCTMMCSLPVRRETLFITTYLTGLVPMLLIDILAVAVTAAPALASGYVDGINLWRLLAVLVLSNVAFYSFGVFCSVLTGNIVVLPAVYFILNVAVVLAESTVREVLDILVYGFNDMSGKLTAFSPVAASASGWFYPQGETAEVVKNGQRYMEETGKFTIDHFHVLFIYCAVGLALVALALYVYRRRDMECAGDVVAVPILKPIFKYCMCFGVAFCFATLVYNNIFYRLANGSAEAFIVITLLLVGAFLGYFVSEMLMQKTLRVFRGKWKGYIISAALLCVFVLAVELDVTGYEKYIPQVSDIESASIAYYEGANLEKEESIKAVTDYHALLLEEKGANESAKNSESIVIEYTLENGKLVSRNYPIAKDEAQLIDMESPINRLSPVVNLQEAIDKRAATEIPVTVENVQSGWLNGYYVDSEREYHHFDVELTKEQIVDLYNNCVLPDASEGKLKRIFPVNNEEYYSCATTVNFNFDMRGTDYRHYYYDFVMYMDAPRCVEWIRENTDVELLPMKEADWCNAENDINYVRTHGKPVMESSVRVG